jgi:hypothetical protein
MKVATESYSLIESRLPTIPTPHDCVIKGITLHDGWLTFLFEDDILYHDSIRYTHPSAQTLKMRIHITDATETELYAYERRKYETVYVQRKLKKLFDLAKRECKLEYLYHYVAYGAMQIELFADQCYIVRLLADRVILEWIEE